MKENFDRFTCFVQYSKLANTTKVPDASVLSNFNEIEAQRTHMLYGMIEEIQELKIALHNSDEVNFIEELGDFLWFLNGFQRLDNINLPIVIQDTMHVSYLKYPNGFPDPCGSINLSYGFTQQALVALDGINSNVIELVNIHKKRIAYNKVLEDEQYEYFKITEKIVRKLRSVFGVNVIIEAMYKNINKLANRYPDGFNELRAVDRDIDKERKSLEE